MLLFIFRKVKKKGLRTHPALTPSTILCNTEALAQELLLSSSHASLGLWFLPCRILREGPVFCGYWSTVHDGYWSAPGVTLLFYFLLDWSSSPVHLRYSLLQMLYFSMQCGPSTSVSCSFLNLFSPPSLLPNTRNFSAFSSAPYVVYYLLEEIVYLETGPCILVQRRVW